MAYDRNKMCLCGGLATTRKSSGSVCDRCARIERDMRQQSRVSKVSSGYASIVDTYTVAIRATPGTLRRSL
jgi:hypothetical protein